MPRKLYPLGIQTFERIRKEDKLYVDKTEYVYRMTHTDGTYFFLSRPRRFGKSLLVSTFQSYFEGRKDLFRGLAIDSLEKEWDQYPVLHFDMSLGKHMDNDQFHRYLLDIIESQEEKFGCVSQKQDANLRLKDLIANVYQQTGRQVVVLIDEYDAPLLDVAHEQESLDALRNTMRNFYSPLKGCEPMLRFVFLTGITKFSQLSIFSELNNIKNISMDEPYAAVCGITEQEMLTQMSNDIDELAATLHMSREATIDELKNHYDGYHFCWPSPDIYNPYSLLNCLADGKMNAYWFGSGTPTYLINMMKRFNVQPSQLGKVRAKAVSFDVATESMISLVPLLYQSGYLTIKDYDEKINVYTLDIPNKEISVGLFDSLLPGYLEAGVDEGRVVIADVSECLNNGDIDAALSLMANFLETVPYCDNTHYEGHWQQTLYIMFALLTDYHILVEQHTVRGRIDITLETAANIYVMELKFNRSVEEAIDQISTRRYADTFRLKNKTVIAVGLNFSMKDGFNVLEWKHAN